MGRLIDADVLIKKLRRTSVFECVRNAADKNVFEIIDEQPTAYDQDAVVAELEQQAEQYNRRALELVDKSTEAGIHNKGKAYSYEHAIEIVRKGGIDG